MDALPLELYEQIFEYLVPVYDVREIVTLPTYTKEQRQDIYNIRLTSRWLQRHSTLHFTRVIQDVPTGCMNLGMQKLASLAKTPGVGEKMTCLSLNGFAQVIVHKKSEDGDRQFRVVPEWLRESFPEILRKVLSDMPLIRDLVCIMNCLDWANTEAYNDGWSLCEQNTDEWLEKDSIAWLHELRSPLKVR